MINAIRYLALLALYGGFTAVMYAVIYMEHPTNPERTPPLSPAMQCVINLTLQFFFVYLGLFVFITLKQFTGMGSLMISLFSAGIHTVTFAPMLAILFIATRMRALQIATATDGTTPPTAGPQPWSQSCMYLCTGAMSLQLLMLFL